MQPQPRPAILPVRLRPVRPGDAELLTCWRREPSVRRFQPLSEVSASQLRAELAHQRLDDLYRGTGDKFQWVVLADRQPAGWITLVVTNWEHGLAEVGYALSTPFQRRGIMPRALRLLLEDLFAHTALHRLEARCAVENRASQSILDRLGFVREGRLRGYFVLDGRRVDNYLYSVLRADFERR